MAEKDQSSAAGWDVAPKLLMIAGSIADTRYKTDEMFAKATGTEDKRLFLIDGVPHIETYWGDEYVDAAIAQLTEFFARTL